MKCVNDHFLIQCVNNETRGNNILDLVFVSEENKVKKFGGLGNCLIIVIII